MIRQRILVLWANYRLHHITVTMAKAVTALVVFSVTAAPVVTPVIHPKPVVQSPIVTKTTTSSKASAGAPVKPKQKPVVAAPVPAPTPSAPPPAATPTEPAPATPSPLPATAPTPGSGAKKLVPTANSAPPDTSTTTSTPTTTTTTTPSDSGSTGDLPPATGGYTSTNWAGYAALAGGYTTVSGSWKVPVASSTSTPATSGDSTWIGIGGVFSQDLIQTGTMNIISADGQVETSAFYELLPEAAMEITSMTVTAGDSMTASIQETSPGIWLITLSDLASGDSYSNSIAYSSTYSSAEWIEEDPSYTDSTLMPFDNFSTTWFSNANTTVNGALATIAGATGKPITLVNSAGTARATPSVLTDSGSGFSVTRN